MKKLYTVLFVVAMSLFVSCDRENSDGISNEMAIKMSVSVDKTKAILTTDNIINTSIGVFGYKEQISNQNNKYLVFNNEKLSFESDSWAYSPVRYWDTQTAYSFIAYAPYQENSDDVSVNSFDGITIKNILQWQNADFNNSKDYVVALSRDEAVDYISRNEGVNLKFHHILANLQISAYYEGDDADFVITGLTLGADTCKVPAVDANRSYSQDFGSERADGVFSAISLEASSVSLTENSYSYLVSKSVGLAANILVAPFDAEDGKQLPLTITYSENGTSKTATVNTGITQFESDNVYTLTLKFKTTETPVGPSGPGVEVLLDGFSIADGDMKYCLAVGSDGNLEIGSIQDTNVDALIWNREFRDNGKFALSCTYNNQTYYLTNNNSNVNLLAITDDSSEALEFAICYDGGFNGNGANGPFLQTVVETVVDGEIIEDVFYVMHNQNDGHPMTFVLWKNDGTPFEDNTNNITYSGLTRSKFYDLEDMVICSQENGFTGPIIFFYAYNINNYSNFDFKNRVVSSGGQPINLNLLLCEKDLSILYFYDENERQWKANFYYEGSSEIHSSPHNILNDLSNATVTWSIIRADGKDKDDDFDSRVSISGSNTGAQLYYTNPFAEDIGIQVIATVNFNDGEREPRVAKYGLILKGQTNQE